MASDDEDDDAFARFVPSGRFSRLAKMGGLAAHVAGSSVKKRIGAMFAGEEERERALREGFLKNAERMVKTMGEMKGAAMKLGQILSVAPDILPREFLEPLKALQREAPAMDYGQVSTQFERSVGRSIPDVFRYFDPKPSGAASVGQVHRGILFDGRTVAVKIQYPGIAETLDSDLRNLGSMLGLARVIADKQTIQSYMEEIRSGLLEEIDYQREARNLAEFGAILGAHPKIVVPGVVAELSTKTVLTMEFLEGRKLDEAIDAETDPERKNQLGIDFSQLFVWMFHERQVIHADPHPGNFLYLPDGRFGLLDFGCMRRFSSEFTDGWIDILVARWRNQPERLRGIFDRLGFKAMGGSAGPANEDLVAWTDIVVAPFLVDRDFSFGDWRPHADLDRLLRLKMALLRYAAPAEGLFYFRVCAGVWGFLQRCQVHSNWYQMGHEMAARRGRL